MSHFLLTPHFESGNPKYAQIISEKIKSEGFSLSHQFEDLQGIGNFIFCRSISEVPREYKKDHMIVISGESNQDLFQDPSQESYFEIHSMNDLEALLFLIKNRMNQLAARSKEQIHKNIKKIKKKIVESEYALEERITDSLIKMEKEQDLKVLLNAFNIKSRSFLINPDILFDSALGVLLDPKEDEERASILALLFIQNHIESIKFDEKKLNQIKEELDDEIICLFNKSHDPVWLSSMVSELGVNPIELVGEAKNRISFGQQCYHINRFHLDSGETLVWLKKSTWDKKSEHNEELGIISSSIAHELNNPLGGILAAIDVLSLEDVSGDTEEALQDMKKTVLRCKKLVETFLGFAKKDLNSQQGLAYQEIVERAYDLIKFRLLETNYKLQWDYSQLDSFRLTCNESVMTMIFYLLFNKIITDHSHKSLLEQKQSPLINLSIIENRDFVSVEYDKALKIDFSTEALFGNLFELSRLRYSSESGRLVIDGL